MLHDGWFEGRRGAWSPRHRRHGRGANTTPLSPPGAEQLLRSSRPPPSPNTPLSRRGMPRGTLEGHNDCPGRLQRMVRRTAPGQRRGDRIHYRSHPPRLPHQRDRTPRPHPASRAAPTCRGRAASAARAPLTAGPRRPLPSPPTPDRRLSVAGNNYLSATEDPDPVGGQRRTTRSAAGAAWGDFTTRESLTAAPVGGSGWFGEAYRAGRPSWLV